MDPVDGSDPTSAPVVAIATQPGVSLEGSPNQDILVGNDGDESFNSVGVGDQVLGGSGYDKAFFSLSKISADEPLIYNLLTGEGPGAGRLEDVEDLGGQLSAGQDDVTNDIQLTTLRAGEGIDSLTLDYSGAMDDDRVIDRIFLHLGSDNHAEKIYFTNDTSIGLSLGEFERVDVTGTSGDDIVRTDGLPGDNRFIGLDGKDRFWGGNGVDLFEGGLDTDTYTGGGNLDRFQGTAAELNGDRITDLEVGEVIQVFDAVSSLTSDQVRISDKKLEIDSDRDGEFETVLTVDTLTGNEVFSVQSALQKCWC